MIDLYKNIKSRRIELGMSQQALAEKVGYTGKSMVSKVERGEIDLSTTMIQKFADALKTTPSDLMGWNDLEWEPETQEIYYEDNETADYTAFLHQNSEYKVLFDAVTTVKKEDIQKVLKAIGLFTDDN